MFYGPVSRLSSSSIICNFTIEEYLKGNREMKDKTQSKEGEYMEVFKYM
jgi:hypothetical protein